MQDRLEKAAKKTSFSCGNIDRVRGSIIQSDSLYSSFTRTSRNLSLQPLQHEDATPAAFHFIAYHIPLCACTIENRFVERHCIYPGTLEGNES